MHPRLPRSCTIQGGSDTGLGVLCMGKGAQADLQGCTIAGRLGHALAVSKGAVARASQCKFSGCQLQVGERA